jgi:hypothetical protein
MPRRSCRACCTRKVVLRDLQRVCSCCDHKRRCDSDIAGGKLGQTYERYCPNAYTLDALNEDLSFTVDRKARLP